MVDLYLPISHLVPRKPVLQSHVNPPCVFVQVPRLLHIFGTVSHSFTSIFIIFHRCKFEIYEINNLPLWNLLFESNDLFDICPQSKTQYTGRKILRCCTRKFLHFDKADLRMPPTLQIVTKINLQKIRIR